MSDENHIIRADENVLSRIMHNTAEQDPNLLSVPLQRHVAFNRFELGSAGSRNQRQQSLADAVERQDTRRVDVAQDAHDARMLLVQADDDLRLDRAIAQPRHDSLLNVGQRPCGCGNLTRIGHVDASLLVDRLRRQIDKVARPGTSRSRGRKQAARRRFKDGDVQDVADTCDLLRLRTLIRKCALESDEARLREEAERIGTDVNHGIR